jgi:hypothetical protein
VCLPFYISSGCHGRRTGSVQLQKILEYVFGGRTGNTVVVHTVYPYWQHCCGTHCISLLATQLWYTLYIATNSPDCKYKHLLLNSGTIIFTNIVSTVRQTVHVFGLCENAMELNVNIFTPT